MKAGEKEWERKSKRARRINEKRISSVSFSSAKPSWRKREREGEEENCRPSSVRFFLGINSYGKIDSIGVITGDLDMENDD